MARKLGTPGNDFIAGTEKGDVLRGFAGGDHIFGGKGNDLVDGGTGDDVGLRGGEGNDTVRGGSGNDGVYGGSGKDYIDGQAGVDDLIGGLGDDELSGGADFDRFFINSGDGNDTILDFDGDIIYLGGFEKINSSPALQLNGLFDRAEAFKLLDIHEVGGDSIVDLGGRQTLTLLNVTGLTASDFDYFVNAIPDQNSSFFQDDSPGVLIG